jgi:hypothetical protein
MATNKSSTKKQKRYFLLTAGMQITEEVTKAVIAKNAQDAEDKVEDEITIQDFSEWHEQGVDFRSAAELIRVSELTKQEYDDYIASH